MGLKFNGRRILQSSFIRFMGRSCSRVLFNARVVWQRIPDYLYNAGDQITEWTGGWQQKDTYMAHNDYWFGNTPGAVSGLNGQLTINADNMKAYMPYDGQLYQGVLVSTVKQIDLTHISGLTAIFTASEMWGGGYASMGVTQRFENKYQPIWATGGVCSRISFNTAGPHSVTLDTTQLTGLYFVCFTTCVDNGAKLSTYLQRIKVS